MGSVAEKMRYYDLKRNWTKKIVPHLEDKKLNELLVRDFNKFTMGRWNTQFIKGMFPEDVESCDWRCDHIGKEPKYWKYVRHSACHWIVNFSLRLAMLSEPNKIWQIVSSQVHSTVWDGKYTLFDFNFQAMGITPEQAWELAIQEEKILKPRKYLRTYKPTSYKLDLPKS